MGIKTTRHIGSKVLFIRLLFLFIWEGLLGWVGLDKSIRNLLRTNTAYFIVGNISFYRLGSV